jgi:succinoglycan biosynthesis protein ExoM
VVAVRKLAVTMDSEPAAHTDPVHEAVAAPVISVIIPTFHRPAGALAAVRSIFAQENAASFEVLLVDNDAQGSAQAVAAILEAEAPCQFTYAIEAKAGVANARNTAVGLAQGAFVAFLDDDEVAKPNWLSNLLKAQQVTGADVVFGPIEARLPDTAPEPRGYFQKFFSREFDGPTRLVDEPWGCGNAFLRKATTLTSEQPFDVRTNETGGEDDLLWRDVRAKGGTFGWAHDAWVYEDVPASRANWGFITKRAFSYGRNTTAQWFEGSQPNWLVGLGSMLRGAAQAVAMAPLAGLFTLIGHPLRAITYDKMLRGLGKVLWFGPFKVALYGEAVVKKAAKNA